MSGRVVVVVPAYRPAPSGHETISLQRCGQLLGQQRLALAMPSGCTPHEYLKLAPGAAVEVFPDRYFDGVQGYNSLLLSSEFYRRFSVFDYILIAQLDTFIFSDELDEWVARGFDYVGAPWWNQVDTLSLRVPLPFLRQPVRVGNGGLSLRRVRSCLWALRLFRQSALRWQTNEDLFWSAFVPAWWPWFRIPDFETALGFAIETQPRRSVELLGRLPFGCHAWSRYDLEFWRPHIEACGYSL